METAARPGLSSPPMRLLLPTLRLAFHVKRAEGDWSSTLGYSARKRRLPHAEEAALSVKSSAVRAPNDQWPHRWCWFARRCRVSNDAEAAKFTRTACELAPSAASLVRFARADANLFHPPGASRIEQQWRAGRPSRGSIARLGPVRRCCRSSTREPAACCEPRRRARRSGHAAASSFVRADAAPSRDAETAERRTYTDG